MASTIGRIFKWTGIILIGIVVIIFIAGATNTSPQTNAPAAQSASAPTTVNTDASQSGNSSASVTSKLKINASAESGSIAFSSEANYTNCSDSLDVITVDGNGQPTFTMYTDNYGSINLFAGDQHSVGYGSLTDSNGDTLAADLNSGMYGSNTAGTWGLTCDQGQYSLLVNAL